MDVDRSPERDTRGVLQSALHASAPSKLSTRKYQPRSSPRPSNVDLDPSRRSRLRFGEDQSGRSWGDKYLGNGSTIVRARG